MRQRWRYVSAALEHFDPDLVFSVGMFSPLLFSLYQSRPVLSLCVHAFAPSTPCDVWLCADPALAGRESMHWGAQLPPSYASFHPFRIAHRCTPGLTTRAELGLTQDRLIVISIGDRLHAEITGAWAQAMLALLARRPDICWLLVGGAGQLPASLATAAPESVRPLPAQDSVGDLLALSDIYLNPPRVGGGFSVADAMAEALPVVSFGDSDGGIKIGALAVANMTAYFTYLDALLASTPLRASTGAALRACFENTLSLAHSHQSLDAAINITLNRFNARSAPS